MNAIAAITKEELIQKLAIPSNIRLGQEIAKDGRVEITESQPSQVKAKVKGEPSRKVEIKVAEGKLIWKCTCTSNINLFCKHCVAVSLVSRSQLFDFVR